MEEQVITNQQLNELHSRVIKLKKFGKSIGLFVTVDHDMETELEEGFINLFAELYEGK